MITDPHFYAVTVPAVLLLGVSKSGFGAGFGSLAVPMMALAVSVPQAAAILMPVLLVMDLLGMAAFRKDFDLRLLRFLVPFGLLGIVIGALLFKVLDARVVAGIVGVFTLLFLAQRLLFPIRRDGRPPPAWAAPLCSATSGFTSFVAHAGGPPLMAYVLPLKLAPMVASATMAAYFTAINLVKLVPYAALGLMDLRNLATSLLLLPLAPVGVWLGVRLVERTDPTWFYRLAYVGMAVAGVKLLWDGLGG